MMNRLLDKFLEICAEELAGRRTILSRVSIRDWDVMISTWFGSGFLFPAAGTWGTLAGLPFAIILYLISPAVLLAGFIAVTVGGFFAVRKTEARTNIHDSPCYVIDEVSAICLILLTLPVFNAFYIILAFIVYRAFDTIKPWPVSWADREIPGAWGVMIDDLLAAGYSILVVWGIYYVIAR